MEFHGAGELQLKRLGIVRGGAKKQGRWPPLVRKVLNTLQGSVAIRLRCDGIFNCDCIASLLVSLSVKEF